MGDYLGTNSIANTKRTFIDFEEAKKFVQEFKFSGETAWKKYCKSGDKPNFIPSSPARTYKDKGWISFGDFFGHGKIAPVKYEYVSYEEAKLFVHKLGIKSQQEWWDYVKTGNKPANIPYNPERYYKNSK